MFLTIPTTITKGSVITIPMSIPNLLLFGKVSNNPYYADSSNWKSFSIEFTDEVRNQKALGLIEFTGQTGLVNFIFTVTSEYESDNLIFRRMSIFDKANGSLSIGRGDISPQDSYDMSF